MSCEKSHSLLKKNALRKEREQKKAAVEEKKELDYIVSLKEQIDKINGELIAKEVIIEDLKSQIILRDLYERETIDSYENTL